MMGTHIYELFKLNTKLNWTLSYESLISDLFLKFRFLRKPQKFGLPLRFDVTKCKITPNLCGLLKKPEL